MDSFCDITLFAEDKEIEAHQEVLRKASPYFAKIFDRLKTKGKHLVLPIADISYEGLFDAIKFIYTGEISEDRENSESFRKAINLLDLEFQVIVKNNKEENHTFVVRSSDTVLSLKQKIQEKEGIQDDQQKLIFGGRLFENEKILGDYRVTVGTTIHLDLKLCSGYPTRRGEPFHQTQALTAFSFKFK